jgi:hypothetical protein
MESTPYNVSAALGISPVTEGPILAILGCSRALKMTFLTTIRRIL